jgi:hypothetical protein
MNPFGIKTEECNGNDWTTGYRLPSLSCGGMSTFEQLKQSVEKAKAVLTAEARDSRNYFSAGFGMGMGIGSSSSGGGGHPVGSNNTSSNRMSDMGLIGDLSHHLNHSSHLNHSAIHHQPHHPSSTSLNSQQHERLSSSHEVTSTPVADQNKRTSSNNNNNNNGTPYIVYTFTYLINLSFGLLTSAIC